MCLWWQCDLFYVTWRKTRRRTAPPPLPSTAEATPPPKEGEGMAVVALASLGNATVTHYLRALTRGRQPRRATQVSQSMDTERKEQGEGKRGAVLRGLGS